jgi:hypothetical protein
MNSRGYAWRVVSANKTANSRHPGVKLGRFCIERDISVRDIAKEFGVSRMTIYKWFTGEWHPRRSHVDQIVRYLSTQASK